MTDSGGVLEDNVGKKQEEKHKHQAGTGWDRVYLLNPVLEQRKFLRLRGLCYYFQNCPCNQLRIVDLSN